MIEVTLLSLGSIHFLYSPITTNYANSVQNFYHFIKIHGIRQRSIVNKKKKLKKKLIIK